MTAGRHPARIALLLCACVLLTPAAKASAPAPDARDQAVLQACGAGHAILHRAARRVAFRALARKPPETMLQLGEQLRAWGEPHPGARAWSLRGPRVDRRHALDRLRRWLAKYDDGAPRRCGVASVEDSERGTVLAVVTVPVLADLRVPLATSLPHGRWVTVDAQMRQWASAAKVVVLGPRGAPRTIPTSYDRRSRRILGRFMADRQGLWLVQVVATTRDGPKPVLESAVHVGQPAKKVTPRAPGETAGPSLSDADAMFAKLNAARRSEGLPPLARDRLLDHVAEQHVRRMINAGLVVHDAGDGTPPQRVAAAGLSSSEVGENVSRASCTTLAHRALWSSPSHRANMLHPRYLRVGVAAIRDSLGRVWTTQVFMGKDLQAY